MAISLTHAFVSPKADGGDSTLVQPSNWNAEHTMTLTSGYMVGRSTAGVGAIEEIAVGANLSLSAGTLNLASSVSVTALSLSSITYNSISLTPTAAEFNYLSGVTSGIQSQLNAKASTTAPTIAGTTTMETILADSSETDTAAAPSYSWFNDTDTGLFHSGADEIAVTTAGTERVRFIGNGAIGLGGANYGAVGQSIVSAGSGAAAAWGDVRLTLLGTIATTSGTSQSLIGLDLTSYRVLRFFFANVTIASAGTLRIDGVVISASSTGAFRGTAEIELTEGTGKSSIAITTGAATNYAPDTSYTTATTSVVISTSGPAFTAGNVYVFGEP